MNLHQITSLSELQIKAMANLRARYCVPGSEQAGYGYEFEFTTNSLRFRSNGYPWEEFSQHHLEDWASRHYASGRTA